MASDRIDFVCFSALASPAQAASAARELYGKDACTAAAWCALEAHFDGRTDDYRFWFTVFCRLGGAGDELPAPPHTDEDSDPVPDRPVRRLN